MKKYQEYNYDDLKKLQKILTEMLIDFNKICEENNINYFALDGTGLGAIRHGGFIPWDDDIDLRMLRDDYNKLKKVIDKEYNEKYFIMDFDNTKKYPNNFPKLCLKGTKFIDETTYELGLEYGIFIDIYVFDYLPIDEKSRNKLLKKAWIFSKIGTLSLVKKPLIYSSGIKKIIIQFICFISYYLLKIFGINSLKMFNKADKLMKSCNKSKYIGFAYESNPYKNVHNIDDIFPLVKKKFESTYVYMPKEYDKLLSDYYGDYMTMPPLEERHNHAPKILDFGNYD